MSISLPERVLAPAKVNLCLYVGERRPDGLHEICSLFQSVSLVDELVFDRAADGEADCVSCLGVEGRDTVSEAIGKFRDATGWSGPGLSVTVEKRIPVAAGLGGGSADAAAALRTLNALAGTPLNLDELRVLGMGIGADVPSQIEPGLWLVGGAGELLERPGMEVEFALVLIPQSQRLSTAEVYSAYDRRGRAGSFQPGRHAERLREELTLDGLVKELNSLQDTVIEMVPSVSSALEALTSAGALAARVTGSGPTAFGIFESFEAASSSASHLSSLGATAVSPVGPDFGGAN